MIWMALIPVVMSLLFCLKHTMSAQICFGLVQFLFGALHLLLLFNCFDTKFAATLINWIDLRTQSNWKEFSFES